MAQQHTTPEKSLAAAADHEQRARAGSESRLRKDSCYELYEASLKCLDQNDYQQHMCEEAFEKFKACRANQKSTKAGGETTSAWSSMVKAQEKDPLLGPILKLFSLASSAGSQLGEAVSSAVNKQAEPEAEPEWKVAKRQREEQQRQQQEQEQEAQEQERQRQQQQQEEQLLQQQQQQQQQQQRSRWRWFGAGKDKQ